MAESGDEKRFGEYVERQQQLHRRRMALQARAPIDPIPCDQLAGHVAQRRAARRRTNAIALASTLLIGLLLAGLWWGLRPRPQVYVQDTAQALFAQMAGLPLEVEGRMGILLRLVPPGEFEMGSPLDEPGRKINEAQRKVRISRPFYIAVTEITQWQYQDVVRTNPVPEAEARASAPVYYVTWEDAIRFCNALSRQEGLPESYRLVDGTWFCELSDGGYRLPLETEWEYACRAGSGDAFYTGPIQPEREGKRNLTRAAWYIGNSGSSAHDAAQKEANRWGLYDMLGNVEEWCMEGLEKDPLPQTIKLSPVSEERTRMLRGGGWYSGLPQCRSAARQSRNQEIMMNSVGFRCVRSIPGEFPIAGVEVMK